MNLSRTNLYRIILEEYLISEGYWNHPGDDAAEELLKKIMGDKYQPPEERHSKQGGISDRATAPMEKPQVDTAPMEKPHSGNNETIPIDMDPPPDDATKSDEPEYYSEGSLEDQLMDLIQGMPPEEVADLFQVVFEKIPGVELSSPEDEDSPGEETLYSPGAEGRPVAGFQLQELMELIREVIEEGHYHDMGDEEEMYDALDPHGFEKMTDAELVNTLWTDGMEKMIILDGEGDLANREEVITALKDV